MRLEFRPRVLCLLQLSATAIDTLETIYFQRISVIVADVVLFVGCGLMIHARSAPWSVGEKQGGGTTLFLITCNFGLLLVDHIHFQYNGMLLGLLLSSVACLYTRCNTCASLLFALLVCCKHLFIVMAPIFGIVLLVGSWEASQAPNISPYQRAAAVMFPLLAPVGLVCAVFAPFVYHCADGAGQLGLMVARMFPFQRGLVHSYWAPNVWALYTCADKVLGGFRSVKLLQRFFPAQLDAPPPLLPPTAPYARLLVLPAISPAASAVICIVCTIPLCWLVVRRRHDLSNWLTVHRALCMAYMNFFLFGWHVHEKAVLYVLIPMLSFPGAFSPRELLSFMVPACTSLLPLIFTPLEQAPVLVGFALFLLCAFVALGRPSIPPYWRAYLVLGIPVLCLYYLHGILVPHLPFLHLLAVSVWCAAGLLMSYTEMLLSLFLPATTKRSLNIKSA